METKPITVVIFNMIILWSCLASVSKAQRSIVYPCISLEAIRWVRDGMNCKQYYICHFGQPLAMPQCPRNQVWSLAASNCVPEKSRWDDCDLHDYKTTTTATVYDTINPQIGPNSLQKETKGLARNRYKVTEQPQLSRKDRVHTIYENSLDRDMVISIQQLPTTPSNTNETFKNVQRTFGTSTLPTYYTGGDTELANNSRNILKSKDNQNLHKTRNKISDIEESHQRNVIWTPSPWYRRQNFRRHRQKINFRKLKKISRDGGIGLALKRLYFKNPDHPCLYNPGALLPHPTMCHWYFNCTVAAIGTLVDTRGVYKPTERSSDQLRDVFYHLEPSPVSGEDPLVWECRYPQLFDQGTGKCREFMNVDCGERFEAVDVCEYSQYHCAKGRCAPCEGRFGHCRGRANGVYPLHEDSWTPVFVTCYKERNIAQDECTQPTPVFSPKKMDCVSLFEVPKVYGGFQPDCSGRPDGYYPDEQGRCAIFFRCSLGSFRGFDECPPGSVFDPALPACQPFSLASRPCGEGQGPVCGGRQDGLYADPYGRCTHFFQCTSGVFQRYSSCDLGIFDPLTSKCVVSAELTLRPCGLQPSPCETLPTGVYPDQATGCQHYIECHSGVLLTNATCPAGTVFSAITGRCDHPDNTPPPCGFSSICRGKPDGRYPATSRGCSFFYECYHDEFLSLRRCTAEDGGFFFNPATGECDFPQNICPPCGYRWWGCASTYRL